MTDVAAARKTLMDGGVVRQAVPDATSGEQQAAWLSPRQRWLGWLWAQYRCEQYKKCRLDWNGQENLSKTEHDFVATAGFLPAGFYDAGQTLPLKFRSPSAPVHLVPVIVHRFTSLLFSQQRHPKIVCPEDVQTSEWVNAAINSARLWSHFMLARNYGGATGSVGMGFKIVRGKIQFEVFDPRTCTPDFLDKSTGELASLEKRYMFTDYLRDPKSGNLVEAQFWYRRVIDDESDTVWKKVPAFDGVEPDWDTAAHSQILHGLGECPVQWIQNKPLQDEIDGDPDCHGVFDLCWATDALWSQAHTGTLKNCDPTVHIATDADIDALDKGSGNAVKTEKGGTFEYAEITGSGPTTAITLAEKLEQRIQLVARCFFDTQETVARTATEVERDYSSMMEEADVRREQYGEHGIKPLLEKLIRAARKLGSATIDRTNPELPRLVRQVILLPKKPVIDPDTGTITNLVEHQVGEGETVELHWPPYFTASLSDMAMGVRAAADAKTSGLIDQAHATSFVAPYFQVENSTEMLKRIKAEQAELSSSTETDMMRRMRPQPAVGPKLGVAAKPAVPSGQSALGKARTAAAGVAETAVPDRDIFSYDISLGVVTINEARAHKGLPPIAGGEMTLPQRDASLTVKTKVAIDDQTTKPPAPKPMGSPQSQTRGSADAHRAARDAHSAAAREPGNHKAAIHLRRAAEHDSKS